MEIQQLIYLKEIARLESFSRASETLHVTQSALSKSIAKLESELGVKLLDRHGNGVRVNRFGQTLLQYGNQALTSLESGTLQVRSMAGLEDKTVRIGVSADVFIKHLVRDFMIKNEDVSMYCLLLSQEQMTTNLMLGTVDFCLCIDPISGEEIVWEPLYEDQLTIMVAKNHPLANREYVYLKEFAQDGFITTNLGYGMKNATLDFCHMSGFEPKVIYEGYDTEIAEILIGSGRAVEITPHSITEGVSLYLREKPLLEIRHVKLADSFSQKTIGVAFRKGHHFSAASLAFYNEIARFYASIV